MTTAPTDHPIAVSATSAIHEGRVTPWSDRSPWDAAVADGAHDLAGWLHERGARSASGA